MNPVDETLPQWVDVTNNKGWEVGITEVSIFVFEADFGEGVHERIGVCIDQVARNGKRN